MGLLMTESPDCDWTRPNKKVAVLFCGVPRRGRLVLVASPTEQRFGYWTRKQDVNYQNARQVMNLPEANPHLS
jgi:hypothetical protein